jgi:hypothetical protein
MEHLELGGKKYMKVSSAARETGYTSDYIGQLCRAKKIDAKLVGRTWYVAQDEITAHKRTRGRSSFEKTRKAVRAAILEKNEETVIPVRIASTHEYRTRLIKSEVSYHADDAELIPTVLRSQKPLAVHLEVQGKEKDTVVSINHASPKRVAVSEHEEVVQFNKTAPKEVSWNGTIVVSALPEEQESEEQAPQVTSMEKHLHVASENVRSNKPKLAISHTEHDPLVAQSRFLDRMNLAHDLNNIQRVASKMKKVVDESKREEQRSILRAVPSAKPQVTPEVATAKKTHRLRALLGVSGATLAVAVGVVAASLFLVSEHEYRAVTNKSAEFMLPYSSSVRMSSLFEAELALAETISNIRDIYISKHIFGNK